MRTILIAIALCAAWAFRAAAGDETVFFSFEQPGDVWTAPSGSANGVSGVRVGGERVLEGKGALRVDLALPGEATVQRDFFRDLTRHRTLTVNLYAETGAPADLRALVFLQDGEWLWYQSPLYPLASGKWTRLALDVRPESPVWQNAGHPQPWSRRSAATVKRIGVKLFSASAWRGPVFIDEVSGGAGGFPDYSVSSREVPVYGRTEITFFLPETAANPFDPEDISVDGLFTGPDGREIAVPGFHHQGYARSLEGGEERLTPEGYPCWKIRFSPATEGRHAFRIRVRDRSGERVTREDALLATAPRTPGFVRVSAVDRRYFAFSDGSFFRPVGLNIRSPTDTRYAALRRTPMPPDDGTFYYDRIFARMRESGQNTAEVWMAAWFCALEWIDNRLGYRGVGQYNLRNAWKLDAVFDAARRNGIYLQIVVINHGQLSTYCDEEWALNPYNVRNGGFLRSPEEFFTDARARALTRNKLRYIVARWGAEENLFSLVLINEINLIGSSGRFHLEPTVGEWYGEMGAWLERIDPWDHLVSAHYTVLVDNNVVRCPYVDYTITNAYYDVRSASLFSFLSGIWGFNSRFGKPAFVSEYGGTPHGSQEENLKRDVTGGLWMCAHLPFAGGPFFWWHRFVDERNLYPSYAGLRTYLAGIDRLRTDLNPETVGLEGPAAGRTSAAAMGNRTSAICFLYDRAAGGNLDASGPPAETSGLRVVLRGKAPGRYRVAFHDPAGGSPPGPPLTLPCDDGVLRFEAPPFLLWLAFRAEPSPE